MMYFFATTQTFLCHERVLPTSEEALCLETNRTVSAPTSAYVAPCFTLLYPPHRIEGGGTPGSGTNRAVLPTSTPFLHCGTTAEDPGLRFFKKTKIKNEKSNRFRNSRDKVIVLLFLYSRALCAIFFHLHRRQKVVEFPC